MYDRICHCYSQPCIRHYLRVVAFGVFGAVLGALAAYLVIYAEAIVSQDPRVDEVFDDVAANAPPSYTLPSSEPVRIRVPTVGIDAEFEGSLGLNTDRSIEVPDSYEKVGWYRYGPTPGELGPAVILGHVDSYKGPAVFWPLRQVEIGDHVVIDRADGSTATFVVEQTDKRSQEDFPTKEVYADLPYAGLRIITCTGIYNHGSLRYSHNFIVYARLIEEGEENTEL